MIIRVELETTSGWMPPSDQAVILKHFDNQIWDKYNWLSGKETDFDLYIKELNKKTKEANIDYISGLVLEILEDENYHTLVEALSILFNTSYENGWQDGHYVGLKNYKPIKNESIKTYRLKDFI